MHHVFAVIIIKYMAYKKQSHTLCKISRFCIFCTHIFMYIISVMKFFYFSSGNMIKHKVVYIKQRNVGPTE